MRTIIIKYFDEGLFATRLAEKLNELNSIKSITHIDVDYSTCYHQGMDKVQYSALIVYY